MEEKTTRKHEDDPVILRVIRYGAVKHPELPQITGFGGIMEQIPIDLGFTEGEFPEKVHKYQQTRHPEIAVWDFNGIMDAMLKELGF